jgi:hypothetical protein
MIEKTNPSSFSLKTLFWIVFVISVLLAGAVIVNNAFDQMFAGHTGPVTNPDEWPHALKTALEQNSDAIDNINVFEMNDFIDHRSIWSIDGHTKMVDGLISTHSMIPVKMSHPMADELRDSVRKGWPLPNFEDSEWYATDGFGTQHIEGPDQFLFAVDRKNNVTIVLHHWNF